MRHRTSSRARCGTRCSARTCTRRAPWRRGRLSRRCRCQCRQVSSARGIDVVILLQILMPLRCRSMQARVVCTLVPDQSDTSCQDIIAPLVQRPCVGRVKLRHVLAGAQLRLQCCNPQPLRSRAAGQPTRPRHCCSFWHSGWRRAAPCTPASWTSRRACSRLVSACQVGQLLQRGDDNLPSVLCTCVNCPMHLARSAGQHTTWL